MTIVSIISIITILILIGFTTKLLSDNSKLMNENIKLRREKPYYERPAPIPPMPNTLDTGMIPHSRGWLIVDDYIIRKDEIRLLSKNPNGTINVILPNGETVNTGMTEKEISIVMGASYMWSVKYEFERKTKKQKVKIQ